MDVVFISNYINHHQIPLSNALYTLLDGKYTFIQTMPMGKERVQLGWAEGDKALPYVLPAYQSQETAQLCMKIAAQADVVILGSAPSQYLTQRLGQNKVTIRYCERLFKKGTYRRFIPATRRKVWDGYTRHKDKRLYAICASGYASADLLRCRFPPDKCFKWGYFPETRRQDYSQLLEKKLGQPVRLLWVGRFIGWKRPAFAIKTARYLKSKGHDFHLDMIGTGTYEGKLKRLAQKYHLEENVSFLGAMPPEKVRDHMERAHIFLMTSDFNEGWGAVLNEAMNSGCAVVASHAAGSTPFLLKDGENGLIYNSFRIRDLYQKTERLVCDRHLISRLGEGAILTINEVWNAEEAAQRLVHFLQSALRDETAAFESGPLSRAGIIKNNWYKGIMV